MPQVKSVLAPNLHITPSRLYVKDLQKVAAYYRDTVRLDVLERTDSRVVFGYNQTPVLELVSKPEYSNAPLSSAGLFHNAIVYTSRSELARTIYNILVHEPASFEGSADHLVSEAFYFHDPELNGLELYYDRPRETWRWDTQGVKMDTLYLDPEAFILQYANEKPDTSKELGHVHLRVGDVPAARKFYVEQLGFDVTADIGSALFVSVGGYHHHLAMNTWASKSAGPRIPSLGLADIKLLLPNDGSIDSLANRLVNHQLHFEQKNGNLRIADPWNNKLVFAAA